MKSVGQDIVQYVATALQQKSESYILFTQAAHGWTIDLYFAVDTCVVLSKEEALVSQHRFFYPSSFLERYYSTIELLSARSSSAFELCCESRELLQQFLKTPPQQGPARKMQIESCALAILMCVIQKQQPFQVDLCQRCSFSKNPADSDKIQLAQELLLANLAIPLTIPQLAQKVGLNQCYLKKGFKEMFGQTVYDYLQEQRMSQAKRLLHTEQYTIAQVAEMVGFSSANSFATAFKRIVGMQPSEWAKN